MDQDLIIKKFGRNYFASEATFVMGIHHLIAKKIAPRFGHRERVLDACSCAGFLSIALAKYAARVVAVDINPDHLEMARQNAVIAGCDKRIDFVLGDVSSDRVLGSVGKIDAASLDMDWAVGENKRIHVRKLPQMMPPADVLFEKVSNLTPNICIRLPKEFDLGELATMPVHELEEVFMDGKIKFIWRILESSFKNRGRAGLSCRQRNVYRVD